MMTIAEKILARASGQSSVKPENGLSKSVILQVDYFDFVTMLLAFLFGKIYIVIIMLTPKKTFY
jgi:hypothetical protein